MSEWIRQYTYDDDLYTINKLQRYLDSGNYDFQFYNGLRWNKKTGNRIIPNTDYRYKKKEDEHLDYEFFKDMPPMQIIRNNEIIYDVTSKDKNNIYFGQGNVFSYRELAEKACKWRVLKVCFDLAGRFVTYYWSEWKTFKKEYYG